MRGGQSCEDFANQENNKPNPRLFSSRGGGTAKTSKICPIGNRCANHGLDSYLVPLALAVSLQVTALSRTNCHSAAHVTAQPSRHRMLLLEEGAARNAADVRDAPRLLVPPHPQPGLIASVRVQPTPWRTRPPANRCLCTSTHHLSQSGPQKHKGHRLRRPSNSCRV